MSGERGEAHSTFTDAYTADDSDGDGDGEGTGEVLAMMREVLAQRTALAAELAAARRAAATNGRLRDENARLLHQLAEVTTRAERAEQHAERAQQRTDKLGRSVAAAHANHRAELERLQRRHEAELVDLRAEHRRAMVNRARTDLERSTAPATPSTRDLDEPAQPALSRRDTAQWQARVRRMRVADGADSHLVTIYNTLTANQQFVLKALVIGQVSGHLANALRMSHLNVQRHIATIRRRFGESTQVGLVTLCRDLFAEGDESSGQQSQRARSRNPNRSTT